MSTDDRKRYVHEPEEAAIAAECRRLVEWMSDFCAEHAEWADDQFEKGTAEGDWLDDLYAVTGKVRG